MVVVVVVVVFMVMVVLVALDHRNHKPRAPRWAGRLLSLQAWQYRGHRGLLLGVGLRGERGFGRRQSLSGFGPNAFAVTVLQRVLVVAGGLGLVGQVVHILTAVGHCVATVQHGLQRGVVAMTLGGLPTSTTPIISSAALVGSFGRFEKLRTLASRLCGVVAIADDLRTAMVNNLGFGFLRARATLAVGAPTMSLLWREGRGSSFKSGGVVFYSCQVQVVIPPLCVLIHTVMLTLSGRRLVALPSADVGRQSFVCRTPLLLVTSICPCFFFMASGLWCNGQFHS